ncbi:hypothetical protein OSTOST_21551 [Ostertagia ostertagi]
MCHALDSHQESLPVSDDNTNKISNLGYVYGENHFTTFDGSKYSFHGKGHYILSMMKSPRPRLHAPSTIGAATRNVVGRTRAFNSFDRFGGQRQSFSNSAEKLVHISFTCSDSRCSLAKTIDAWRYRTDVFVDGERIFFDMPWKKIQLFKVSKNRES